jgi:sarcosine oxidase subunit beta
MTGGWCYGGFKATPASGYVHAWTIANDKPHPLNAAFHARALRRRTRDRRKGRGSVSMGSLRTEPQR